MTAAPPPAVSVEQVQVLAHLAGLPIAPEHLPGVVRNLEILLGQAEVLDRAVLGAAVEPAAVYTP